MEQKMEQREIDPRVREANSLIKLIMIATDKFYPDDEISEDALREKCFFRSKVMYCINKIAKYEMKESDN